MSETRRILLVDDDRRVHELVRWVLRPPRFEVHAFADPRRALDGLTDLKPSLIICDMMMPSMDGQAFIRLVKQMPTVREVPFLFLTAVRLSSELQAAFDAGADAYLVKPFPLAKLVETVDKILAPAAEEGRAPTGNAPPPETSLAAPQRPDASQGPAEQEERAPSEGEAPTISFESLISTIERDGSQIQVVTEANNRPDLVILTAISIGDRGVRRIESFWSHPWRRPEDIELVKRQIDLQHERAVADARREPLFGTRRGRVWSRRERRRARR